MGSPFHVATSVTTEVGHVDTVERLCAPLRDKFGQRPIDLCLMFVSAHFEERLPGIAEGVAEALGPRSFIGATTETAIAGATEYESQPAVVLWAAHLPGGTPRSFHLGHADMLEIKTPDGIRDYLGLSDSSINGFILLGDPFSIDPGALLRLLAAGFPGTVAIGGMASAGAEPRQNLLVFDGITLREGMCGVALTGRTRIDPVVSQGARPVGDPMVVTRGEGQVILELGGRRPVDVVHEIVTRGPKRDAALVMDSRIAIGRVVNEQQASFAQGDFLIRNVLGFNQSNGAMVINDLVRVGQTVQIHVHDAAAARHDLKQRLDTARTADASGALVFSCNGRGTRLFDSRSEDARAVSAHVPPECVAGMSCAGELGPVGGRNFVHGYTASVGLIRAADA